jgi:hypothetical protein
LFARHSGFAAASCTDNIEKQNAEDQIELAEMREVGPQSETRLREALQRLAAASPQSLPAAAGAELLGKFRRHHARRRWIRRGGMIALSTCLALAVIWSWRSPSQRQSGQENLAKSVTGNEQKQSAPPLVVAAASKPAQPTPVRPRPTTRATATANRAFLALPAYDPAVPLDELQIVRVKLPASALWKIGAPVPPDMGERRMTADFVVGQDGTAYAVRLVQ